MRFILDFCMTIISTVVASLVGATVAFAVSRSTIKAQVRQSLHDQVNRIVDLGITYPQLENSAFCQKWNSDAISDEAMRYDNYCCQVFNMLESLWRFTKGNSSKMTEFVYFEELLFRHKRWWYTQIQNRKGYQSGFHEFIDNILLKGEVKSC
jgi:hypothetical protein